MEQLVDDAVDGSRDGFSILIVEVGRLLEQPIEFRCATPCSPRAGW